MPNLRKIWIAFVRANNLEVSVDFGNQRKVYSGLFMEGRTEGEFRQTIEFQGFLDGYEHHYHRYNELRGTPELNVVSFVESILNGQNDNVKGLVRTILDDGSEELKTSLRRVAGEIAQESSKTRYDEQYKLGLSSGSLIL